MHKDKSLTRLLMVIAMLLAANGIKAQIGEHRDDLSIGGNAGVSLSSVGFVQKVNQGQHIGPTAGFSVRYVCEKYYSMVCSVDPVH